MKRQDLKSMSVDQLWSLHELIISVLTRKISAEKAQLNRRLRQLDAGPNNGKKIAHARRPYPRCFPSFKIPLSPRRLRRAVENNRAG